MENKKQKVVLVGINHAGTTAIKALVKSNPNMEIVAFDRSKDNISFLGCGIALWVGKEFTDPKGLFYATVEKLRKLGAKINMGHEMINFDPKNKVIEVKDLQTGEIKKESYDKLILAIGSWPVSAPGGKEIPGLFELKDGLKQPDLLNGYKLTQGVHFSKIYEHAQEIIKHADQKDVKNVVVIGAGYIGIELVEAFYKAEKNVTLIDFENRIMPRYYDAQFTDGLEADMKKCGVNLELEQTVSEIITKDNKVTHVKTNKGQFAADLVIMAVGFLPNTEIVKNVNAHQTEEKHKIKLDNRGAIVVNEYFQTSNPDIYAIGDCIAIHSNAWKSNVNIALATNAVRSGLVAGLNVGTGNKVPSPGVQGTNAISVFGWKLSATGLSHVSAPVCLNTVVQSIYFEDTVYPPFMQENHRVKLKITWDKATRRIVGAQVGSTYDHSEIMFMFSLAIMKGLKIDELPLVDMYFLPHFNKPYNYVTAAALIGIGLMDINDVEYPDPWSQGKPPVIIHEESEPRK